MQKEVGRPKRDFVPVVPNQKLQEKVSVEFEQDTRNALAINEKLERYKNISALKKNLEDKLAAHFSDYGLTEDSSFQAEANNAIESLMYKILREDILEKGKRIGGRGLKDVRDIEVETNILTTPHGSALFTRGETQVLSTVTVGGAKGEQLVDRIVGQTYENFYLHYNFPPFSVGEARPKFSVGRRELGHGNLAERAIKAVLPSKEDFAYTIRVACEVLESNGSSSMGSVCAGSMACMDAGIPLTSPVAGIAMGLVMEKDRYKILTDILGDEDHLGDMDFKVAGTSQGITAIQMDIKIMGLSPDIMKEALEQAREGRVHILKEMGKGIQIPRSEFKEGVPRIMSIKIPQDKIGALIGPGGKNIKALQEQFDVTIECSEEGLVRVLGVDKDKTQNCIDSISLQINGPETGRVYIGKVASLKDYGAFVDIVPGMSGLVHVSELSNERVQDINDYLSEGDSLKVKVMEVDRMGRIKLSAKAVEPISKKKK
jgi:polyribonucleotide nucleotidyltransferase